MSPPEPWLAWEGVGALVPNSQLSLRWVLFAAANGGSSALAWICCCCVPV